MFVVEKDKVISGMLEGELIRCEDMLERLNKAVSNMQKGSINKRIKKYKDKKYVYYYLKYRIGIKSYSKHISLNELDSIKEMIEKRKKYMDEIKIYKNRAMYLRRIISIGNKGLHKNAHLR